MTVVRIPVKELDNLEQPSRSIVDGSPGEGVITIRARGLAIKPLGLIPMIAGPSIRLCLDHLSSQQFGHYDRLLVRRTKLAVLTILMIIVNLVLLMVPDHGAAGRALVSAIKLTSAIGWSVQAIAMAMLLITAIQEAAKRPPSYPTTARDGSIHISHVDPSVADEWNALNAGRIMKGTG